MVKNAFYHQLHAVQQSFSKDGIVIIMGDLNVTVGSNDTFLGYVMVKHGFGDPLRGGGGG